MDRSGRIIRRGREHERWVAPKSCVQTRLRADICRCRSSWGHGLGDSVAAPPMPLPHCLMGRLNLSFVCPARRLRGGVCVCMAGQSTWHHPERHRPSRLPAQWAGRDADGDATADQIARLGRRAGVCFPSGFPSGRNLARGIWRRASQNRRGQSWVMVQYESVALGVA